MSEPNHGFPVYTDWQARALRAESDLTAAQAEIARLREALEPFAKAAEHIPLDQFDGKLVAHVPGGPHAEDFRRMNAGLTAGAFRRAAQALAQSRGE